MLALASTVRLARPLHPTHPITAAISIPRTTRGRFIAFTRWASTAEVPAGDVRKSLALPATSRTSQIGIQSLSKELHQKIFPKASDPKAPDHLVELAKQHLRRHDLLGKNTDGAGPIAFNIPDLLGESKTLDEHFTRLGKDSSEPYLRIASEFAMSGHPIRPKQWAVRSGWTKYVPDEKGGCIAVPVDVPDDNMLSFDTEVLYKDNPYAIMACAMSPTHWYSWLSPWLLGETEDRHHLIPLGDPSKERIIVGHNIGFDRARILEEYDLKQTRNCFIDTMSLHVAVNGMCSQQRPTWMRHRKTKELQMQFEENPFDEELAEQIKVRSMEEEELWIERSSINSLRDVAQFHLNIAMDKTVRDEFGTLDREGVNEKLQELIDYCATDVQITHKVYRLVFPNFLETCPHPVSFAALRHLSAVILPINKSWEHYIKTAEETYLTMNTGVNDRLRALAEKALELKDKPEVYENDPWYSQLDWSGQEVRMTKGTKKEPPRPVARQKLPGMPMWYKDLFPKVSEPMNLTVRTRIAPLLLRLCWEDHPLVWSSKYGWVFKVAPEELKSYTDRQMIRCEFDQDENVQKLIDDTENAYFKLPHKDGPKARCTNPMAKSYLSYFEKGTLSSEFPYAKEALEMNACCSYWISARDRIKGQMAVYEENFKGDKATPGQGYILPQIIPMGTITRRAVENTWLTASNAKKNRVGSELKAMVKAPEGYCFVGADVDSEELWIASLVGDATFQLHGGNAIGFMTLEGTKAAGTDMHSRTASILGITRNDAKVFNYGRIYGAGLKFAATLLRQFNPSLTEAETLQTAGRLYIKTKGIKTSKKVISEQKFWRGGTESFVFNKLEEFAGQPRPRTFVLGAGITEALLARNVSKSGYLTSRINWAIQSSGVDYLHMLIVAMDYLIRKYTIDARLSITVHDEIRYLVSLKDRYRAAMALQVANLWTRAMFAEQVGIHDLPQAVGFFSAVDIDSVLRKEVNMDCLTPSHPTPIPHGESIDIYELLEKGDEARLDQGITPDPESEPHPERYSYTPRMSVMELMKTETELQHELTFIKAQITDDDKELEELVIERLTPKGAAGAMGRSDKEMMKEIARESRNRPKAKGGKSATRMDWSRPPSPDTCPPADRAPSYRSAPVKPVVSRPVVPKKAAEAVAKPVATESVASKSAVTKKAPEVAAKPVAAEPVVSKPVVAKKAAEVAAKPVVAEPIASEPVVTKKAAEAVPEPVATEPVGSESVVTKKAAEVATESVASESITSEPVVTKKAPEAAVEPDTAEPVTAEPIIAGSVIAEPVTPKKVRAKKAPKAADEPVTPKKARAKKASKAADELATAEPVTPKKTRTRKTSKAIDEPVAAEPVASKRPRAKKASRVGEEPVTVEPDTTEPVTAEPVTPKKAGAKKALKAAAQSVVAESTTAELAAQQPTSPKQPIAINLSVPPGSPIKPTPSNLAPEAPKRGRGRPMQVTNVTYQAKKKDTPDPHQLKMFSQTMYAQAEAITKKKVTVRLRDAEFEKFLPVYDGPPAFDGPPSSDPRKSGA